MQKNIINQTAGGAWRESNPSALLAGGPTLSFCKGGSCNVGTSENCFWWSITKVRIRTPYRPCLHALQSDSSVGFFLHPITPNVSLSKPDRLSCQVCCHSLQTSHP